MAVAKPVWWVSSLLTRFEEQLPCRIGPQTYHSRINVQQNKESLIHISQFKFSLVISGLTKTLQKINEMKPQLPHLERGYYESLIIILDTLERCLRQQANILHAHQKNAARGEESGTMMMASVPPCATSKHEEVVNFKNLLKEICHFIDMPNDNSNMVNQIRDLTAKVLFSLSVNNFSAVFSRISSRLQELSVSSEENPDHTDVELIQYIDVDMARLTKLLSESISKFKSLKKSAYLALMNALEKAIWNWMHNYSHEFTELQSKRNEELTKVCELFFDTLDNFAENKGKHRNAIWPLQILLLVLTPKVLEEIHNADSGAPCSTRHMSKKKFIDSVKKALNPHGSSKAMTEAAIVTCVKLCKAATYINILDSNNVIFSLVQSVIADLKMLLFKADKPFFRGTPILPQEIELLIDFFLANFRLNPHNNDTLKVCLNTQSPSLYHHVLVTSLHNIITQKRLPWWPQISILYNKSSELKAMFLETLTRVTQGYTTHTPLKIIPSITLKDKVYPKFKASGSDNEGNFHKGLLLGMVRLIHADPMLMLNSQGKAAHEVQSSTLELINGLVSLVQNSSIPDVSHEAMEALLVLHQPEKIEMWNPEAPINTFWDLSSQVLFSMSQKLIQHLIVNYTDVLKWLRKILECRNQFLQKHCEYANVGSSIGTPLQFRQFLLSQKKTRPKKS